MLDSSTIVRNIEAISNSPSRNSAVKACCDAATLAFRKAREVEDTYDMEEKIANAAITAYCDAMPSLDSFENIRDYVACVTHAMLLGVIDPSDGPKFLYAAQIALGVLPRQPKNPVGRPQKAEK